MNPSPPPAMSPPLRRNPSSPTSSAPISPIPLSTPPGGTEEPIARARSPAMNESGGNEGEVNFKAQETIGETRVYPLRRVVHMKPLEVSEQDDTASEISSDHTRQSSGFDSRLSSFPSPIRTNSNLANPSSVDGRSDNDFSDQSPPPSPGPNSFSYPLTTRFSHTVTVDGSNLVVTGRDGKLERCEDEVSSLSLLPLSS